MQNMSEEVDNFLTEDQVEELVMRQDIHEILGDILPLCVNEEKQLCPVETQQ